MMNRRTFLTVSAVTAAGVLIPVPKGGAEVGADNPATWKQEGARPSSWITPSEQFYIQDITNGNWPQIDETKWRLIINGLVKKPRIVLYDDVMALDPVSGYRTLSCIGDPIGGAQIGNAEWTGVPVRALLGPAEPRQQATRVVFRGADGYHTAIPLEDAMNEKALLAFKMNGEPLPREHGFPLRFLNPGKYGQKCPKWIINMELVEKEYLGYWETRGWSDKAAVRMATRIHLPGASDELPSGVYRISGSAFDGGNEGTIAGVEVSTDGGDTWNAADIWAAGSPLTWSLWQYEWAVPSSVHGVRILARSISVGGKRQSQTYTDPFPAGARGYHAVEVEVAS